jgi:MHS family proline/betaine transporter-like MFS transporter
MSTDTAPAGAASASDAEQGQSRRSMLVAAFGTVVEWYDFTLYLYLAPVLTRVFFGGSESSLLYTFGVFAAAYGIRPVGAMVFGNLGDKIGRKNSLVVSAVMMAVAMFLTACIPSRDSIGLTAPILLFALRCVMGFSVGGEYTGILVYLLEGAKRKNRGYATAWAAANSEIGTLLSVGISALLLSTISEQQMDAWGWRVTFVVGGFLALTMLFLRRHLEETASFERVKQQGETSKSPLKDVIRQQPRAVKMAFIIGSVTSVAYYLNVTYVPTFLTEEVMLAGASSMLIATVAAAAVLIVTPPIGAWSDRSGRRKVLIGWTIALIVATPLLFVLMTVQSSVAAFAGVVLIAIPAAAVTSVSSSAMAEQFAAPGRFSGLAIGFNVSTAIFGGFTPLIATGLIQLTGWKPAPGVYLAVVCLVLLPFLWRMRETANQPLYDTVAQMRQAGIDPGGGPNGDDSGSGDPYPQESSSGRTATAPARG